MVMAVRLRYPKFLLLLLTFALAYAIFNGRDLSLVQEFIHGLGYAGSFISGIMYSYGFTAGPATALLLIMAKQQNVFISALVAGIGSLFMPGVTIGCNSWIGPNLVVHEDAPSDVILVLKQQFEHRKR